MPTDDTAFEGWFVVEMMGHRKLAGYVREVTVAGAGLLRVDVPGDEAAGVQPATQFYPPSAIYCLTPTTEEIARTAARSWRPAAERLRGPHAHARARRTRDADEAAGGTPAAPAARPVLRVARDEYDADEDA